MHANAAQIEMNALSRECKRQTETERVREREGGGRAG